jgi:hypothetical protein
MQLKTVYAEVRITKPGRLYTTLLQGFLYYIINIIIIIITE